MTNPHPTIRVEVAYALADKQKIIELEVDPGTTARQAVALSRIADDFPEIDIAAASLGIFGQELGRRGMPDADVYQVQQGDRVEIYRPLIIDPKEVRRQRAAEARAKRRQ